MQSCNVVGGVRPNHSELYALPRRGVRAGEQEEQDEERSCEAAGSNEAGRKNAKTREDEEAQHLQWEFFFKTWIKHLKFVVLCMYWVSGTTRN